MYQPMLYLHWKQVRLGLLPLVVAAFGLPLLSIQGLGAATSSTEVYRAMELTSLWLPLFPVLAIAVGVTLALTAWSWDHKMDHVYALSLPIPRWRYALLKMGAGAALALVPMAAFWLGAHLAVLSLEVPATLSAYPNELALRFALAVLVSYAGLFALAAGTVRTTVMVLTALVALPFLAAFADGILADHFGYFQETSLLETLFTSLVDTGGPLRIFTGSWALIDV